MGSTEILVSGGVAALLAALAGGGLKAFGVEVPALASVKRQVLLALAGVALVIVGLAPWRDGEVPENETAANDAVPATSATQTIPEPARAVSSAPTRPDVPNIGDLPFAAARQFLIQNGWAPIRMVSPMGNDNLGFRQEEVFETGFFEAVACSGTQTAPCLFRYRNPSGFILEVTTWGEDLNTATVHDARILDCSSDPKPEGCGF